MDSLTHIVLSGVIAGAIAPGGHRRAALMAGAALGTMPDLDVVALSLMKADVVTQITWHRGPAHSIPLLLIAGWVIWWLAGKRWETVRAEPRRWFWAIEAALLAYPLLDACTVYGTQLWWPVPVAPAMWASIFIADPLFTVPLIAAFGAAWFLRARRGAQIALVAGLSLSGAYLGWAFGAKALVERQIVAQGLGSEAHFSVPSPLNTLLWRVVVLTPEGYLEGERSLVSDCGPIEFRAYVTDRAAFAAVREFAAVKRIDWFTHGFLKTEEREGRLVLSDLRMGAEPDYIFRYGVAERDGKGGWREVPVEQVRWPYERLTDIGSIWRRIWRGTCHEAQTH